jgi:hypothetical protein
MSLSLLQELLKDAKPTIKSDFIKPGGKYRFEIQNILTYRGHKGHFFIAELKTLTSTKLDPTATVNAEGSSCSYMCNLANESGPGNMLGFLMAVTNEPKEKVLAKLDSIVGEKSVLRYAPVDCEAYSVKTKKGADFTATRWTHVPLTDAQEKDILARQKAADKAATKAA